MEGWVVLLRWAGQLALAILLGGSAFLLIGERAGVVRQEWTARAERMLPVFWLIFLGSGMAVVAAQAALVSSIASSADLISGSVVWEYALGTHTGRVAVTRIAVATALVFPLCVLSLWGKRPPSRKVALAGLITLAGGVSALGPMAGHAAADETTKWLVPIHVAHVLGMSVWLGGLPFWVAYVVDAMKEADADARGRLRAVLVTFSSMAMSCMLVLVGSGVALAWVYFNSAGDLLGTRYGAILCAKVVLLAGVLMIANRIRSKVLPALTGVGAGASLPSAARWVSVELALAAAVAGLGVLIGQTTPAIHDQPVWLFGRRLSLEATWPDSETAVVALTAVIAAAISGAWLLTSWRRLGLPGRMLLGATALTATGAALWMSSVPAYRDTYRRSTVPYMTVSIAQGMQRFGELCTDCHGLGGLGDGKSAGKLLKPPANLSEPHTALHTAGDMFWWMSQGIPESGMPGFAAQLDEQARWDVVNFLRAFSEGFQARTLDIEVVPDGPWLGAPNFYLEGEAEGLVELKDYRERSNVLLVFLPNGEKGLRRELQMVAWSTALRRERTEVLLISDDVSEHAEVSMIQRGAREIRQTYDLLARTITNRGDRTSLGMEREHMEFLIDRFGYIRARWIPEESATGWERLDRLIQELRMLNRESRILPPPDDHIH